ncbi:MAG: VapC toxin family PIN domain ribonuclease [Burkholderiales bacterium]|nr:VapC toxin family PIN domain ribonuclease [Burkholderiales bacterium]
MRALLDINVLIALHDREHIHHERAALWLESNIAHGWASCPLTQNGCLRIMSQPGYSSPQPLAVLVTMLQGSTGTAFHTLWADDISLLDARYFHHPHIHGHKQLTDLYLLALAVRNGGRLVSFDQRIPLSAVQGARAEHLVKL